MHRFGSQNMRSKPLIGRIGLSAKKTNVIRGSLRRQLRDKTEIGQITLRRFAVGHSPNADRPLLRDPLLDKLQDKDVHVIVFGDLNARTGDQQINSSDIVLDTDFWHDKGDNNNLRCSKDSLSHHLPSFQDLAHPVDILRNSLPRRITHEIINQSEHSLIDNSLLRIVGKS